MTAASSAPSAPSGHSARMSLAEYVAVDARLLAPKP